MSNSQQKNNAVKRYKKGEVLFVDGEPSHFLYMIKSGKIGVFKEGHNRLSLKEIVYPQDFIGELHLFNNDPLDYCAVAIEDSEVILVKKSELKAVIHNCPDWVSNIMHTITERLRSTIDVLKEHRIEDELTQLNELDNKKNLVYLESIKNYRSSNS